MPKTIKAHLSTPRNKRNYNRALFDIIAPKYDRVTRFLSFSRDSAWKKLLVEKIRNTPAPCVIDFACGTGDITELLSRRFPNGKIIGADLSPLMLVEADKRHGSSGNISFVRTDMSSAPLKTSCADIVTGGYALRNAPDLKAFIHEIHRILKPGGVAAFLDFSHGRPGVYTFLQHRILLVWGWLWGWLLHRDRNVYGYIADSLEVFPDRKALEQLLKDTGYAHVETRTFFGGTTAIVAFEKPE